MKSNATHEQILSAVSHQVRSRLTGEASGHDWYHIERVANLSRRIAQSEGANGFVCELAALVHDLIDEKLVSNPHSELINLQQTLLELGVDEVTIAHVSEIITTMSFKGGGQPPVRTLEGQVVQDADRLDAIGAIGIARTFAYGGAKGQPMYDPELPVRESMTETEYRYGRSSSIHHFYEKLLKLKNSLNTKSARDLAAGRHQWMEQFLERFYVEWNGLA